MFAVGHLALGYLSGKTTSEILHVDINLPLLFFLSVIPDIDLFLTPFIEHRGPTHSIILLTLLSIPAFIKYGKKALPYYIALILHPTLGDSLTGTQGTQLLWPLNTNWYGLGLCIRSLANSAMEWMLFLISLVIMVKAKDIKTLFRHQHTNLLLAVPTISLLLPTLFYIPLYVPYELLIPHLAYLMLFTLAILTDLKGLFKREPTTETTPNQV